MIILGIETSCDETSAALLEMQQDNFKVLKNAVSSSEELQAKYGGIVPEVAARAQMEYMIPVLQETLIEVVKKQIDAIAVTIGPGLATSLQVGIDTAKSLAYLWQKPIIPVNHLEGHLYSPLLESNSIKFPAIGLIVSGGHTELILLNDFLDYKLLGRTRDDAAGEAFDKVAKLLDLGYPGGPVISKLAAKGNNKAYNFPRGMIDSGDYDFSFSGLKTAVLYKLKELNYNYHSERAKRVEKSPANAETSLEISRQARDDKLTKDIAASFQQAVIDVLVAKSKKAITENNAKTLLVGGGVAANPLLRQKLEQTCSELNVNCLISPMANTGDNAAMITLAGYYRYHNKNFILPNPQSKDWQIIKAQPNLKLI